MQYFFMECLLIVSVSVGLSMVGLSWIMKPFERRAENIIQQLGLIKEEQRRIMERIARIEAD